VNVRPVSWFGSVAVHSAILLLLLLMGMAPPRAVIPPVVPVPLADPKLYLRPRTASGDSGGQGGMRSPLPAARGKLPKRVPRPFVAPQPERMQAPKLVLDAGIEVAIQLDELPAANLPHWGDPLAPSGPPSGGPGCCRSIGDKPGNSVGPGGAGDIGLGGGYRIGGGVSAPVLVFRQEPEYSEEARKAKFQGTVMLSIVVDEKGQPRELRVMQSAGLGLDEKAIEAVRSWRFRPGKKSGKAVPVQAVVMVNFRLL